MTRTRSVLVVRAGLFTVAALAPVAAYAQSPATITHRHPVQGATTGGTKVHLTGSNFATFNTTVDVGGQPATSVVVLSPTSMTFVTPPHAAGVVNVVVHNGFAPSAPFAFRYEPRVVRTLAGARHLSYNYDGSWIAFDTARPLKPADTNGVSDIYVTRKGSGVVRRVSVSTAGAQAIGGESLNPAISASGRFIAFESRATNLVPGDTNNLLDVFLHDRDTDNDGEFDEAGAIRTERISVTSARGQAPDGFSRKPSISGDGRYIVFETSATLVTAGRVPFRTDICVHDRLTRVTRRINISSSGAVSNDSATNPAISQNGQYVAFQSRASNLSGGDVNNFSDIFVHNRDTDFDGVMDEAGAFSTTRISDNPSGVSIQGNGHSTDPSISGDGRYVVFASLADNLDDDPFDTNNESDIFIYDLWVNSMRRVTVWPNGLEFIGPSRKPKISANGSRVVFLTSGLNQAPPPLPPNFFATIDDGKVSTGTIPDPGNAGSEPNVDPPDPNENDDDPVVSGDGSDTGSTGTPTPGSGNPDSTGQMNGVDDEDEEGPEAVPYIASISPASGLTSGGNLVDIYGGNFFGGGGSIVRWGNADLVPQFVNGGHLRVAAPAAAVGIVSVRVRNGGLETDPVSYTYTNAVSAPTITSLAPPTGPVTRTPDLPVTINGTGFVNGATVRFGETPSTSVTFVGANELSVTAPDVLVSGPVSVVVTNPDGGTAVSPAPFVYTDAPAAPSITSVTPQSGLVTGGTSITLIGTGFQAGSAVTVGGVPATDVQVLSSATIMATTPAGVAGSQAVRVTTPAAQSADSSFTYEPIVAAVLSCDTSDDGDGDLVNDDWEEQFGLSPLDPSDGALDWDADGRTNAQECQDQTHPRGLFTRFLAEGATGSFFSTRVVVANPGLMPARVLFRFVTHLGTTVRQFLEIPAQARRTLDVQTIAGLSSANVSTVVESDAEVVVDRTMRWDNQTRAGAHAETSVPAPASTWYLAEGATHGFFSFFYLIQNPSLTQAASVQIRYLRPAPLVPVIRDYTIQPNTRFTVAVDEIAELAATDVSGVVTSLNAVPIIVERAMYSSAAGTFAAGHDAAGVTSPSLTWFFAEGGTGTFFYEFLLLANPNGSDADVAIRYLRPDGSFVDRSYVVAANSRRTLFVAEQSPALAHTAVSATVTVTNAVPIIAERAMWWGQGTAWTEGHAAVGSTTTGIKWAVADGEVGLLPEDTATFLLVANTAAVAATVRMTLLFEAGGALSQDFAVAANSRFTVPVVTSEAAPSATYMRVPRGTRFSAVVESLGATPIVVERAMYWNVEGQFWGAGSDVLATKLQ
jgi:Tol biopolymer transport system component